jgi:hypothetical protein
VGALILFARTVSDAHPGFQERVKGRRFRGLFAKSWASAFPELLASRAFVARLERERAVYEEALAAEKVEPVETQRLLIGEVRADNAAGFAAALGARDPKLIIYRIVCPEVPVWELLDWSTMSLADFVFAMGAREITRLLLGFFEIEPGLNSVTCALASGDEEMIREIWVRTPDEVKARCVGSWLKTAAELQLKVPFRWLLGLASDANLDLAVELMVEDRLVGAVCEVEAAGFDLTRARPSRALSRWSRTMHLVTIPTPSLPSVPASTLLAWHLHALRSWAIPCDQWEALTSGRVEWADPAPRIDLSPLVRTPVERALFIGQTLGGVVFGTFANSPLSREFEGRDPALRSAIFVLEHPTGLQRKWQLQNPDYVIAVIDGCLRFGTGFCVHASGWLYSRGAPEFGMTEEEASVISLRQAGHDGWSFAQIDHWELWRV